MGLRLQHGQSWQGPSLAPAFPQGAPGGSGQLGTPGKRPAQLMPRVLALAASETADFTSFDHADRPGGHALSQDRSYGSGDRRSALVAIQQGQSGSSSSRSAWLALASTPNPNPTTVEAWWRKRAAQTRQIHLLVRDRRHDHDVRSTAWSKCLGRIPLAAAHAATGSPEAHRCVLWAALREELLPLGFQNERPQWRAVACLQCTFL